MALGGRETSISDAGRRQKRWGGKEGGEGIKVDDMQVRKGQRSWSVTKKKHILPLEEWDKNEIRAERRKRAHAYSGGWDWSQKLKAVTYLVEVFSLVSRHCPTPGQTTTLPPPHPLFWTLLLLSLSPPRALETERSECEPPIVEINGIWSARL